MSAEPDPIREQLQRLIDDWIYSLAQEYDNASDRVKQTLEESPASEEDWDAILTSILALVSESNIEARISESNDLFDSLVDVFSNPPKEVSGREEDFSWTATDMIDGLEYLRREWLQKPHLHKESSR